MVFNNLLNTHFGLFPIFYKGMLPMLTIKSGMIVNTNICNGKYVSLGLKYYSGYLRIYPLILF